MTQREVGYYWVRWFPQSKWEPAYWDSENFNGMSHYGHEPYKVGKYLVGNDEDSPDHEE